MALDLPLLPPEEAIAYLIDKGYAISFDWRDVLAEEHAAAFTVAKMMRVDLLETTKRALIKAEEQGWDLKRFSQALRPTLEKEGWWGRKEMVDPDTAEIKEAQLGSPRRLEIIFDTNIRTANSAGAWMRGERSAARLPLLLYRTLRDARVRPLHARWDGVCLPRTDAWWNTHYPPNGWRCRCVAYPISEADVRRLKESGRIDIKTAAPPTQTVEWANPRTGEIRQVPVGIDPGWDYNVGKARRAHLDRLLAEKQAQTMSQAAPPAYSRLRTIGPISDEFRTQCEAVLNAIPARIKDKIAASEYDVVLCDRIVTYRPDLADAQPRGWPKGKTWKNVDGLCNSKSAAVAETVLLNDKWVKSQRASSVLAHEFGHAYDRAGTDGRLSGSEDFRTAYHADASGIASTDRRHIEYFLQAGDAGPQEAFAEMFALATGQISGNYAKILEGAFPTVLEYINALLRDTIP